MKEEKQKIIDKIQKMLLKAKDQEDTPEGNTAKNMACRLMAKYRIKESEIDLDTDSFVKTDFTFMKDIQKVPQWVDQIVAMFCNTFDCRNIYRQYTDRNVYEIIGTFSDVETVYYFVEVVCHHIQEEALEMWPAERNWRKRNQLGNVAAEVIWNRLWELKTEMDKTIHEDENCTALVIRKTEEIRDAIQELYPNLKKGKSKKLDMPDDSATLKAGMEAGESAPLNFAIEEEV